MNREAPHRWSPQLAILAMALVTTFAGCTASAPAPTVVPTPSVTATPPIAPSTGQPTSATPTSATPTPSTTLKQVDPALFRSKQGNVDGYYFAAPGFFGTCGFLDFGFSQFVGCRAVVPLLDMPQCNSPYDWQMVYLAPGKTAVIGCTSLEMFVVRTPITPLRWGEQVTFEGITCTSLKTGLTCLDARTGHGFTASDEAYVAIG